MQVMVLQRELRVERRSWRNLCHLTPKKNASLDLKTQLNQCQKRKKEVKEFSLKRNAPQSQLSTDELSDKNNWIEDLN